MKVYRVCDKEEIDKILNGTDFKDIGAPGIRYKKEPGEIDLNTHIYDENEMYMHFFPDFKDLFYLNLEEGRYICLYDIPEEILNEGLGTGEYVDLFTYSIPRMVPEYCIKSRLLKFEYLKQIDLITHNIDYIDFLSGEPLDGFYENVYIKSREKHY